MKKYEMGLTALMFGDILILFSGAKSFLTVPLWIGFTLAAALQLIEFIRNIRGE